MHIHIYEDNGVRMVREQEKFEQRNGLRGCIYARPVAGSERASGAPGRWSMCVRTAKFVESESRTATAEWVEELQQCPPHSGLGVHEGLRFDSGCSA